MTQVMQLYVCALLSNKMGNAFLADVVYIVLRVSRTFGDSIYLKSISDKNSFYSNFVVLIQ
jgi:hypothetical protein